MTKWLKGACFQFRSLPGDPFRFQSSLFQILKSHQAHRQAASVATPSSNAHSKEQQKKTILKNKKKKNNQPIINKSILNKYVFNLKRTCIQWASITVLLTVDRVQSQTENRAKNELSMGLNCLGHPLLMLRFNFERKKE